VGEKPVTRSKPIAFAYYARGEEHEKMMQKSIASLRKHFPDAPMVEIGDAQIAKEVSSFWAIHPEAAGSRGVDWSRSVCVRLGIPLMDAFDCYKRVVWMDADTEVVSPNVSELADIDLNGCAIGMCPDTMPLYLRRPMELRRLLGTYMNDIYCCAGICVFDLDRIDREEWRKRLADMLLAKAKHGDALYNTDQDLLNAYCKVAVLPYRYGCFAKWVKHGIVKEPVIVHYAGVSRSLYGKLKLSSMKGGAE
jgi:lipopolysaccharide biosynthesis glycosyltransferase